MYKDRRILACVEIVFGRRYKNTDFGRCLGMRGRLKYFLLDNFLYRFVITFISRFYFKLVIFSIWGFVESIRGIDIIKFYGY